MGNVRGGGGRRAGVRKEPKKFHVLLHQPLTPSELGQNHDYDETHSE